MAAKKRERPSTGKGNTKRRENSKSPRATKKPATAAGVRVSAATANLAAAHLTRLADVRKIWQDIGKLGRLVEFRVSCVRPDDLLVCDFIFENLRLVLEGEGAPKLLRKNDSAPVLVVEFPPQSFGEETLLDKTGEEVPADEVFPPESSKKAFPETSDDVKPTGQLKRKNVPTPGDPFPGLALIKIRMAGPSRIAFSMPAEESELSFTIEAILDACRRWPMRLDVNAVPDPPRFRVRRDPLSFRDLWLGSVVNSNEWKETTKTLVDTIGGAHQKKLAAAARRISTKAVEAVQLGVTRDTGTTLHNAINEELDVLAERSNALRDPNRRAVAAVALSFMTTEALTKHRIGSSILDLLDALPFLRLIFPPHEPVYNVTALELPYRLILSPTRDSQWHHRTKAVTRNGRTELWHTRLSSPKKDTGRDTPARVRALWSDDYRPPPDPARPDPNYNKDIIDFVNNIKPFRMSLDALDRQMLVRLMSGFDEEDKNRRPFHPQSAQSNRLALSSLGALLEAEGQWDPPVPRGIGLQQWRHLATLGRDHYVRVVYRGFLCPLRHAASLVKVTERKFEPDGQGRRVAVLRQKFFIMVREKKKHYDGTGHDCEGRNFSFTDAEIKTEVTPTLLAPNKGPCQLSDTSIYGPGIVNPVPHRACFWPMIDETTNFLFDIVATDLSGTNRTFSVPLLFVGIEANEHDDPPTSPETDPPVMQRIIASYKAEEEARRKAGLGGASVCYAPDSGGEGDPRLPTTSITFDAGHLTGVSTDEAQFYPEIHHATVGIAAIQRLLQQPNATVDVTYPEVYKTNGFGAGNEGELFLTLMSPHDLMFGNNVKSDNLGSLATPSMSILGLSRLMGPVAGQSGGTAEAKLSDIINNQFNPAGFFADAKILGGISLAAILEAVAGLHKPEVPKLLSRETAVSIEASFDWKTSRVQKDKDGHFIPHVNGKTTTLDMHGVVSARKNSDAPTFSATATLDNFKVNVANAVVIWFDRLQFTARTGSKPDVAVDLHPTSEAIDFIGPLEFVNALRSIIPSNGFSDPPGLTVTPSGIGASYSINIPSLAVGIFALEHLSLGAGFLLPFDAKPAEVRFNFCERQRPFSLTVSLLGGGGFFAICLGTEGVREIEAALEFGAALSINLGVASGSVEVKAGVYYHWKSTLVELEGYVRLHGELSVLGLISASLTFYLKLGYTKQNRKSVVWGEATLEVEIEILFLSFSVSVSCRREFGGSDGDPKFLQLIPDQTTWNEYCKAFAKETAHP